MCKLEPGWAHNTVFHRGSFFEVESLLQNTSIMRVKVYLDGKWSEPELVTVQPGMDLARRAEETARSIIDKARL